MFNQMTASSVASAIDSHIRANGGQYSSWYIGISKDPNDRLINGHNADGQRNAARYWDASSADSSRVIERHFLDKGCQGSWGGGDDGARYVYTYKVDYRTTE